VESPREREFWLMLLAKLVLSLQGLAGVPEVEVEALELAKR
jgi:hypothetical protein